MDTARKKYATLKDQDPDGQVKLVPLLLDEWTILYPDSEETVRTFLVKIKHLKTQKEIIKKHLGVSGLLPRMDNGTPTTNGENDSELNNSNIISGGVINRKPTENNDVVKAESEIKLEDGVEPFKWHRDMIPDVIIARRNAMRIKNEELAKGRKLSFHRYVFFLNSSFSLQKVILGRSPLGLIPIL